MQVKRVQGAGPAARPAVPCPPHAPSLSYPVSLSVRLLDSTSPPLWVTALALQSVLCPALSPELLALTWHQVVSPVLPSLALQGSKLTVWFYELFRDRCAFARPQPSKPSLLCCMQNISLTLQKQTGLEQKTNKKPCPWCLKDNVV